MPALDEERVKDKEMSEAREQGKDQGKGERHETKAMTRRKFLSNVATSSAAVAIVPRRVLGRGFTPPSDLLNIAAVGVGGMGRANLINLASQNIVALCDVDWDYTNKGFERLDADIRKLQERMSVPDASKESRELDPLKAKGRLDGMIKLQT